tara:strand:- start:767 stop:1276 length:510 start_codon:yes stop_codon:yes gene_type:complete
MIWRPLAWALLLIHFFLPEPFREQVLAIETIVAATNRNMRAIHMVSIFVVVVYFVKTEHHWHWSTFLCHHAIVLGCTLSEYYFKDWRYWTWILMAWSVRWLASLDIYAFPLRACARCIVFGVVAGQNPSIGAGFKWCWILMVHELAWFLLPMQMLYEAYKRKPTLDSLV